MDNKEYLGLKIGTIGVLVTFSGAAIFAISQHFIAKLCVYAGMFVAWIGIMVHVYLFLRKFIFKERGEER